MQRLRSLKQETDAASVFIWCRSRLYHGSLDRPTVYTNACPGVEFAVAPFNRFVAVRFTRHLTQLIQVAL
jgi:hypothetical protein